jgi:lipopolysaccharide biosynthesis protein
MSKAKLITFYLPQYHPIKENDEWWGKGFTDWRNVVRGKPRFKGHYQPHIPADLGFYDLRLEETRIAQAELAKSYGIHGFCYYHYWFNGKMLLERPFNEVLKSGKPDFPFCLCWANENWTRRWDGLEHEVLIEQNYAEYDPIEHISWLKNAFEDKRYIKIDGKPLLLIYNTIGIPDINSKISIWRKWAEENNLKGLYICSVKSIHNNISDEEVINFGFDALVDFMPNNDILEHKKLKNLPRYYFFALINKIIRFLRLENKIKMLPLTVVCDYKKIAAAYSNRKRPENKTYPCVVPNWDNSARKRNSLVVQNNNPDDYENWLSKAIYEVKDNTAEEQIVFINAWNEWAEGCHLEPDMKNGKAYLEATLKAKSSFS